MSDINPRRGEISIKLGDTTYKGKVTLDAMIRIETSMQLGLVKIAQRLSDGDMTLQEIGSILTPVIRGGNNDVQEKDIMKLIWQSGTMEGMRIVGEIIGMALNPDKEKKEETLAKN
tara:strand:+ start:388 stop:735 length:348 start_codon:yes stop_codon:yes gene_type:complete